VFISGREHGLTTFNLADLFEIAADAVPERTALVAGDDRRLSYADLDQRATRVGRHLVEAGVGPGDHVAVLSWNRAEWLEAMLGAFKARAVPVNVNYRYVEAELGYLLSDADAVALVAERSFLDAIERIRGQLPRLSHVVVIEDGSGLDGGAVRYEDAIAGASPERAFGARSGDDRYLLYTGGTTGAPKGVEWRSEDLFFAALSGGNPGGAPIDRPAGLRDVIPDAPQPWLVTSPLMHGNGQWNSLTPLLTGRGVVLWTGHRFDAVAVAGLVTEERPQVLVLVGDGMALPFVDAVAAAPDRFDLTSVAVIASGGAILSPSVKRRLLELMPGCLIVDGFGASETGTSGTLVGDGGDGSPRFSVRSDTAVLDDDLRPLAPGSGVVGRLARRGRIPLGYWNDAEKTARTFPTDADGTRWAIPGDLAVHEADGTIRLLGRGSSCINTGGEKVHPDEVESALKSHPQVRDAFVVGIPDDRFGERVAAVITVRGDQAPDVDEVRSFLRPLLAGYKAPRQVVVVPSLQYTPQGKPDSRWAKDAVAASLTDVGAS
jgi:3-oxocholest-4-en-26-oate---CoA ligase